MLSALRLFLLAVLLLLTIQARADDPLPQLPSLSSSSVVAVSSTNQTITATCYLGNPNDRQTLGSITATSPGEAGSACNSLYYACRGRCFGCYADFDFSDDICVDSSGRKYLR